MARETIISIYLSIHGHLNPLPGFAPEPDRKGPFSIQSTTSIESVSNGKRKDPLISKSLTTTKPIKRLPPILPGKILLEDLKDEGVSMNALAQAIRVPANRISLVFNERRSITADTSLRLSTVPSGQKLTRAGDRQLAVGREGGEASRRGGRSCPVHRRIRMVTDKLGTIVLYGNNFGLCGGMTKARRLLAAMHRITTPDAVIIAAATDPYRTRDPLHSNYHQRNRDSG